MDCCICGPVAATYRPPRNTICHSCYEGARMMGSFLKKLEVGDDGIHNSNQSNRSQLNSLKGLPEVFRWMEERKGLEEGLKEKLDFLGALSVAFRERIHTDIIIEPGIGTPIPAHRALLVRLLVKFSFSDRLGKTRPWIDKYVVTSETRKV